jgi:opacity protein-like surface antigen
MMNTHTRVRVVLSLLVLTISGMPALAQTVDVARRDAPAAPSIEVTPFLSAGGSDFSSRFGGSIAFALSGESAVEAEVGYRRLEMAALAVSANVLYGLPRVRRIAPYVAAGIGVEQYETPRPVPERGTVVVYKNFGVAMSLGGGVKVPITDRWGFRTDVRWLNPWGKVPEGWRIYNGATLRLGKRSPAQSIKSSAQ